MSIITTFISARLLHTAVATHMGLSGFYMLGPEYVVEQDLVRNFYSRLIFSERSLSLFRLPGSYRVV